MGIMASCSSLWLPMICRTRCLTFCMILRGAWLSEDRRDGLCWRCSLLKTSPGAISTSLSGWCMLRADDPITYRRALVAIAVLAAGARLAALLIFGPRFGVD